MSNYKRSVHDIFPSILEKNPFFLELASARVIEIIQNEQGEPTAIRLAEVPDLGDDAAEDVNDEEGDRGSRR